MIRMKFWMSEADRVYSSLYTVFGAIGGDRKKVVPCPPYGAKFKVVEPIETCHPCCGLGLKKINGHNCLPEGCYEVETWEDDRGSHKLYLKDLDTGERVWCFYGRDDDRSCMDWRSVELC